MSTLIQNLHFAKGIDPVANAFAATVSTDVVSMKDHAAVVFVIHKGVGTTGTSVITVEACDDTTPSNTTAVPFFYKTITTGDTDSVLTKATTSGFTTTAGSSQLYLIEVRDRDLAAAGYSYVRLKAAESVDDDVLGGVLIIMGEPRNARDVQPTVLT